MFDRFNWEWRIYRLKDLWQTDKGTVITLSFSAICMVVACTLTYYLALTTN